MDIKKKRVLCFVCLCDAFFLFLLLMKYFNSIKEAHEYYNYPGSYRFGSIYLKDHGIIRSYSNGKKSDYLDGSTFYYEIKDDIHRKRFEETKRNNVKPRLFQKLDNGRVLNHGLVSISKITDKYVLFKIKFKYKI